MRYLKQQSGFTLIEILVATTVFVTVVISLMALFNYVLRINRRSEALRQASQGMRNMVEFVVKQVRNGQIDYGLIDPGGTDVSSLPGPCSSINSSGYGNAQGQDNRLGIVDTDNNEICFHYGKSDGSYVDTFGGTPATFSAAAGENYTMVMSKNSLTAQILNPPNFSVDQLIFYVHPVYDPYAPGKPKAQPFVTISAKFTARLPSGEQVPISYQTSVSTSKYDIPNSP